MVKEPVIKAFKTLAEKGYSPEQVYLAAEKEGYKGIDVWYIVRAAFNFKLDLVDVKEVSLRAKGIANSLDEYQKSLIPALDKAFELMEAEARENKSEDELTKHKNASSRKL